MATSVARARPRNAQLVSPPAMRPPTSAGASPDTYGEAPALVGGLMAGGLTSCAFLGLARATEVAMAAGQGPFVQPPLIAFGLSSLAVAAAFIIGQTDVKRLLAYSSVEHAGLLVLGLGLGGVGAYGSVLHLINNALVI